MNKKLSAYIHLVGGGTPSTQRLDYWDGDICWLSVTDFGKCCRFVYETEKKITKAGLDNSSTKMLDKNDIIISARGTIGAMAQLAKPMSFNQSCYGIRGIKNISDTNFLFYYLKAIIEQLKRRSYGSVFDTITTSTFDEVKFTDFEMCYQVKIADILGSIDKKIETNNKINAELEKMAKTLYDYWFVQFDFPNEDGKPYRTSGGAMTYNPTLKREIPKNWEVKKLSEFCKIESGYPFDSTTYEEIGNYKIITIKSVQEKELDTAKVDFVSILPSNFPKQYQLKVGDLLTSLTGNIGRICFVDEENLLLNQRAGIIIPKEKEIMPYIYELISSTEINTKLIKISGGTSQKNLSPIEAGQLLILAPNEKVIKLFSRIVKVSFDTLIKNKQQNKQLAELRDFLLPLLMTGQVQVVERPNNILKNLNQEYLYQKWRNKIIDEDLPAVARGGSIDEDTLREVFYAIHKNIKFN